MRVLAAFILLALTLPAFGQETTPLPRPRPEPPAVATEPVVPLPRVRPPPSAAAPEATPAAAAEDREAAKDAAPKPPRVYQTACLAVLAGQVEATTLPPLAEGICGARSPLEVTGVLVNGRMVPLSSAATADCALASTLPDWASDIDGYLMARENTRLARIVVGTSYMCRPRNNVSGAEVSEHGFANALDVTGFKLEDGRTIGLPEGWSDPLSPAGRLLRFAHDAACAHFTTTLGPEANALHRDHLHLDLGCHGRSCTARLCE